MSLDVYKRKQQQVKGVFNADSALVTIAGGGRSWVQGLVQGLAANYPQQVRSFRELGSSNIYRATGPAEGQMEIQRIIGHNGSVDIIDDALYDACNVGGVMIIKLNSTECNNVGGGMTNIFGGLTVVNYGISTDANDPFIRERISLLFSYFTKKMF